MLLGSIWECATSLFKDFIQLVDTAVNRQLFFNVHFRHWKAIWLQKENCTKTVRTIVKWYGKTRVTNCKLRELLDTSWKLKSTSWNSKVRVPIDELRFQIHEFKFPSYKFNCTSYEFKSTSCEFKSKSHEFKSTSNEFESTSLQVI